MIYTAGKPQKPELLAPAGNFESFRAAVINGADAVYLGLGAFSARANAQNFTLSTLEKAIAYAHLFNVKVYVAINTLIKDCEIQSALDDAKKAWDCGVSAIIVQDIGFATLLKQKYPSIVLHASTQMGIHNLLGVQAAQKIGIERVILARETPLSEIRHIRENSDIELEHFVHGALCCGFSGNCYFSSLVSGKSGNRGRCLQLCRKQYILSDSEEEKGYWLSTRDTMLLSDLKDLIEAGVCSFKIEGRMRRVEYVAEATRVYRKAIDACCEKPQDFLDKNSTLKREALACNSTLNEDIGDLKLMYNRGDFSKAHLHGFDKKGIIYPNLQNHMGLRVGKVKSVFGSKTIMDCVVNKGDGLKFLRKGKEVGHALVIQNGLKSGFVGDVRQGDEVHLTDSAQKNQEIAKRCRKIPLDIIANFSLQQKNVTIRLKAGSIEKERSYEIDIQPPKNSPLSCQDIAACLTSLGGTEFECTSFHSVFDQPFFAKVSVLKQLRRDFVDQFRNYLIDSFSRKNSNIHTPNPSIFDILPKIDLSKTNTILMCSDEDYEDYKDLADIIVIKPHDYSGLYASIVDKKVSFDRQKCALDLPVMALREDICLLEKIIDTRVFDKFVANNIYALELVREKQIVLGYKMNILNSIIDFPSIKSIESRHEDKDMSYVFGYPDLMQYVHCYYSYKHGCRNCKSQSAISITDDRGENYPIVKQKLVNCFNLLLSSRPVNLINSKKTKQFIDATNLRLGQKELLIAHLKGESSFLEEIDCLQSRHLD